MNAPSLTEPAIAPASRRRGLAVKSCFDRLGAAVSLMILAPVFGAIAILVRLSSPGPILFRRRVVGLRGLEFDAFKFRTMVEDADAFLARSPDLRQAYDSNVKLRHDPRRTRLGSWLRRTSLDELPQLFNVLRGEMSLVGPRMITRDELPKYGAVAALRLSVKPGITGLWQVSGRQELDYSKRVALDVQYIESWSLWLDMRILLKTVPAVLSMRGAY